MKFRPEAWCAMVLGGLTVGQSFALSMGSIRVGSALGEPLQAELRMDGLSDVGAEGKCLSVSEADNGLPGPGPVRVTLQRSDGAWRVQLQGLTALNEPAIQFFLRYDCRGEQLIREYTVLLDPPIASDAAVGQPPERGEPIAVGAQSVSKHRRLKKSTKPPSHPIAPQSESTPSAVSKPSSRHAPKRDVVKINPAPPEGVYSRRESELLEQAVDQVSRMRQMELRIQHLQTLVEQLRAHVPEASAASSTPTMKRADRASAMTSRPASDSARTVVKPIPASTSEQALPPYSPTPSWKTWISGTAVVACFAAVAAYAVGRRRRPIDIATQWNFDLELKTQGSIPRNALRRPVGVVPPDDVSASANRSPTMSSAPAYVEPALQPIEVEHARIPAEEAEWLIAHGEGERALELLREELRSNPEQMQLWLMLFDYLHQQGRKLEFVTLAHRFRRVAVGTEFWRYVCLLGQNLDPDNRLFVVRNE